MVSTETIWTILGVLLVQLMLGGAFAAGYRFGKNAFPAAPAPAPRQEENPEETEARKRARENLQKALSAVMAYDVKTAMKRRTTNG